MSAISYNALNFGSPNNSYKFNGGDEWEESLNMYSTFFRGYDQQIGRFRGVDLLSEQTAGISNYQFSFNNPITFNDPLGNAASPQVSFYDVVRQRTRDYGYANSSSWEESLNDAFNYDMGIFNEDGGGGGRAGGVPRLTRSDIDAMANGSGEWNWNSENGWKEYNNSNDAYLAGLGQLLQDGYWKQQQDSDNPFTFASNKTKVDTWKKFIAIVAGESKNNFWEAAAIASVMINRMLLKNVTFSDDDFISKIGGDDQFDAIGGKIYNDVMSMSWDQILNRSNQYSIRIYGAIYGLWLRIPRPWHQGFDISNGAYFWNASSPRTGGNWINYNSGIFYITATFGNTTFFRYTNLNKHWP